MPLADATYITPRPLARLSDAEARDLEILALGERWKAAHSYRLTIGKECDERPKDKQLNDEWEAALTAEDDLVDLMVPLTPTSPAALVAKARIAREVFNRSRVPGDAPDWDEVIADRLVSDILSMFEGARA